MRFVVAWEGNEKEALQSGSPESGNEKQEHEFAKR
jgi:hypothetical protein